MLIFDVFTTDNSFVGTLLILCAYISALLLSMSVHEFGHAFAANKEGDMTARIMGRYTLAPFSHIDISGIIFLLLFGYGWAKPVPVEPRNFKNGKISQLKVYSAGIVTNLIVGTIFAVIYSLIYVFVPSFFVFSLYGEAVAYFLKLMVVLNFIFAFFNLLPFNSFDGYRLVATVSKPYNKFLLFMRKYSFIILLVSIFTGIITWYINLVPLNLANGLIDGLIKLFRLVVR